MISMFDRFVSKLRPFLDGDGLFQLSPDEWPDLRDTEGEKTPREVARETRERCKRLWRERGPEAWPVLERYADRFAQRVEEAEQELNRLDDDDNHRRRRVLLNQLVTEGKRRAVRRFLRSHDPLDPPADEAPVDEAPVDEAPVIEGRHAPEYALEAQDVLKENPAISTFSKLASHMGRESKVDTLKRAIDYNELSREEKTFSRFKELLFAAEIT